MSEFVTVTYADIDDHEPHAIRIKPVGEKEFVRIPRAVIWSQDDDESVLEVMSDYAEAHGLG